MALNIELPQMSELLIPEIMIPVLIVLLTPLVAKLVDRVFFHLEETPLAGKKIDVTKQRMARSIVRVSIYIFGLGFLFYSIPPLRALSVGLFAGAGILGIVIGLAAQDSLANLVAGVTLAMFQPFRLGDRLKIAGEYGVVEDITLRHTVINTWENKRVIIPNHIISKESIVNYTIKDRKILKSLDVSISYDSDMALARKIMVEEAKKHPDLLFVEKTPDIPIVRLREFGESGINLRLLFWAKDFVTGVKMKYDIVEGIKKRFDKEGIEIPFTYRTIVYKKDLPKPKKLKDSKNIS